MAACATTTLEQIDRADRALARGDLEAAEAGYRDARPNPRDPEPWILAKIEHGLGRIAIERMRSAQPWRALRGNAAEFTRGLSELHRKVRANGGDDDLDRKLAETGASYTRGLLTAFAAHDLNDIGGVAGFADAARQLLALPMLDEELRRQLIQVVTAARDVHLRLATGAPPLTGRVHTALAARFGGSALARSDLDAAYVPYVATTFTGSNCPNAPRSLGLPTTNGPTSVEVTFRIDTCTDASVITPTTESITWSSLFITRITSEVVSEMKCEQERIPTYVCSGSPPTCSYAGTTAGAAQCYATNIRTIYTPIYETRTSTASREVQRQSGSFDVRGSFTLKVNGKEIVESFGGPRALDGLSSTEFRGSPDAALLDARTKGADSEMLAKILSHPGLIVPGASSVRTMASHYQEVYDGAARRISALISAEYASRLAATEASAKAFERAGNTAAADEEWIKVALLGGTPRGRWETWRIDAAALRSAFAELPATGLPSGGTLPEPRVITIPRRPEGTETDRRDSVHSQVPPLNESLWLAGDVDWIDLAPTLVADPRTPGQNLTVGEMTGVVFVGRVGGPLLGLATASKQTSRQASGKFGMVMVDDASLEIAAGHSVGTRDEVSAGGILRLAARYQAGIGYRRRFVGGVFVGVRGEAMYQYAPAGGATSAGVTPFARLELALFRRTLAVEGIDRTLAGDGVRQLGVYLSRLQVEENTADRFTHFLWFQLTERKLDLSYDVPLTIDLELDVSDVTQRSYTVGYGIGF